ncbi:DUF3310 domain-containing protein [Weissella hellenica]|uniref:DUF3310 domain-containing protein n=1 Tax=Weissella hellenica TaxID=46256 RepID=UPI00388A5764
MIYDNVKHPKHYLLSDGTEVKDHINSIVGDMLGRSAWKVANVIKYVARADKKNGLEDLKKAREYIDMLIADKETENSRRGRNWKQFIRVVKRLSR